MSQWPEVHWPAILKFNGDPELLYIADRECWESSVEIQGLIYDNRDRLIDSAGYLFSLRSDGETLFPERSEEIHISLEELTHYIREHHASRGGCCVIKMGFSTIGQAVDSLEYDLT